MSWPRNPRVAPAVVETMGVETMGPAPMNRLLPWIFALALMAMCAFWGKLWPARPNFALGLLVVMILAGRIRFFFRPVEWALKTPAASLNIAAWVIRRARRLRAYS